LNGIQEVTGSIPVSSTEMREAHRRNPVGLSLFRPFVSPEPEGCPGVLRYAFRAIAAGAWRGSLTVNVVPSLAVDVTDTVPPWASTSCFTM
jgi:hypothetical protein